MLIYSPWKIEQNEFLPEQEASIEEQLTFSNGYISQRAFFEEFYPEAGSLDSYLRGIAEPLPPIATISIRLHEERFNLATWNVREFYRCLHRDKPLLERRVIADSPAGQTLRIEARRLLSPGNPHLMEIEYEVRSLNYSGPVSFLGLIGPGEASKQWYPLDTEVSLEKANFFLQSRSSATQVAAAMTFALFKNGEKVQKTPIRIEKQHILGYSITEEIRPGDVFLIRKRVAVTDSLNYPAASHFAALDDYLAME